MMKSSGNQIAKLFAAALVILCMADHAFGQSEATQILDAILKNPEYQKEWVVIKELRFNKMKDQKIIDYLEENYAKPRREANRIKAGKGDPLPSNFSQHDLLFTSSCNTNDIGVELGTFATWQGQTEVWGGCPATAWVTAPLPVSGRIEIVPAPATDPCADAPGFPIPLPSPTGGKYSIKLGNNSSGGESERITHQFIVQPADTNFLYQFSVVFQDPVGHLPTEKPFFDFVILGQAGDTVPCSFQHYVAGVGIPGFQTSTTPAGCSNATSTGIVYYKPWTTVGVNLGKYKGQQVTIVCTTGDCSLCGHMGYAYLDFSCGTTTSSQFCSGTNSVTVVAPVEPGATYSWTPTGATTQSVTVNPLTIDTISVYVNPPSGCGYFVNFILIPTVISPAFTYTLGCNTANFTDNTTITGGTISTYSWSFPGGTPSSYNGQSPPTITYPPGTYNVTLNIISQAGCTAASVPMTITIQPPPTVNAGADVSVCGGNSTVLSASGSPAGGNYVWSPSTNLSNASVANPTAGPVTSPITYVVTYTNANGCSSTDQVSIAIGPPPSAFASYTTALTCKGMVVQMIDSSQNATGWSWDFGDGTTSTLQFPPTHTYGYNGAYIITLVVSNANCRDTLVIPVAVGDINAYITITPPNVFTPNADGMNDCFKPIFGGPNATELETCMRMEIFDRWGIKIFESAGGYVCWDGKTKSNTKAKDGTYYYLISFGETGEEPFVKFKGYVTLLREKK